MVSEQVPNLTSWVGMVPKKNRKQPQDSMLEELVDDQVALPESIGEEEPIVAPLLWSSVGVKPNTWKSRELESFGTLDCSELNSKAQNTSPWRVLSVIGKVSKCRCPKWPRTGHLDICSPSYGQKKQFDSRPLKVKNRPVPNVRSESATRRWKALFEGYKICSDLVAIQGWGEELWLSKVPGVEPGHIRDNFGTPFRESRENVTFQCHSRGVTQSIL